MYVHVSHLVRVFIMLHCCEALERMIISPAQTTYLHNELFLSAAVLLLGGLGELDWGCE